MSEEKEIKTPSGKKLEVEDKGASKIADGIAGTDVGIVKTAEEIVVAPIRIIGRTVDGAIQGVKHGVETSSNPIEKLGKPIVDGVIGAVKGTVKGIEQSAKKVGEGISEIGENISQIGKTLKGEDKDQ